ncbi:efflux RND transporter periplasmic adaptor subunit [Hymenobacter sp. GOD-10R]|uniref:efflux RND transporter periplasmic adaptor subunit n=1 Tax=Hymenobacter sp. GOD-10R TaxID=3093922 RepID=UPI002D793E72|nr:efflux RND transporter periplasmic adaptor subunit [Hymenobacter sp. GOD-10R]WRQ30405.1 efflux RND transporter periplasmic adaptor subunit [Hymenobacter sp. GOD-10R]
MNITRHFLQSTLGACLLTGLGLLTGCNNDPTKEVVTEEPAKDMPYDAVQVTGAQPTQSLSLPGELDSYYQTDIYPRVSSYIKRLHADIGDPVRPGQLLAELEAPELTSALSEALSQLKASQASYSSSRAAYHRLLVTSRTAGAVSPLNLEQAHAKALSDSLMVAAGRAHYQSANQMASYLRITAPFAGVVTERNLAPGAFVGPGGQTALPIFKIRQLSRLRLRLAVPEAYVGSIHLHDSVGFMVRTFPGETFTGVINRLANSVRPETRSEQIEIDVPNPKNRLRPGMFATATLPVNIAKSSLFVPRSAVVSTAERTYVIRITKGRAELVDVQKGDETAGQIQVFGTLKIGDVVLKAGNEEITNHEPLQVELASR